MKLTRVVSVLGEPGSSIVHVMTGVREVRTGFSATGGSEGRTEDLSTLSALGLQQAYIVII